MQWLPLPDPESSPFTRAAIAGCVAISIKLTAVRLGVPLDVVKVGVEMDFDDGALLGVGEAANCLLTTVGSKSALKSWGLKFARRIGPKKARTAVARKLAVLLLGLWKKQNHFESLGA